MAFPQCSGQSENPVTNNKRSVHLCLGLTPIMSFFEEAFWKSPLVWLEWETFWDKRGVKCLERIANSPIFAHAFKFCGNSSVGRAQPCQGWGREFESRFPLSCQCSSVVEHFLGKEEVTGSSPVIGSSARNHPSPPFKLLFYCGNSSVGRAQPCQGWGREFESRFPLHSLRMLGWWNR